ncbi:DUF1499 domain-containing protein [Vibrio sp. SS-MA-C1-2]|uniref:DUF1499 domain-containing protein n=1 Tax=Vibrio sp. SS-MA-C1-2 TaxID=2908646 RepID=UPI001F1CD95B|nr:DUF1499 domain-containing protein [Vibrio sp. SS-MA-C1-2]UJF19793.1 DUF1499 domain-containing protein [Vibrio sp. SS-MA-C1-2]
MSRYLLLPLMLVLLTGCSSQSQEIKGDNIKNQLSECQGDPNCISSSDKREKFYFEPLTLKKDSYDNWRKLSVAIESIPHATLVSSSNEYLHFTFTSQVFGFVDDFELLKKGKTVEVRSESRTGKYDFGVNRKRADSIKKMLEKKALIQ